MEPWIEGLWDAMEKLINASAVQKEATRNGLSSEINDSPPDILGNAALKERYVDVDTKIATAKNWETSLPPLTVSTSSPQIGRQKNTTEDSPTKLASLPTNKSVTSSNTSFPSSPLTTRTTAVPAKPSPLSSPRLKHLDLDHPPAKVGAPTLAPPSTIRTPNQLWTGYRKGALKPIVGKSGDVVDIDDQRDDNFLFEVPSKTYLAPLEGRARSLSLPTADCSENSEGGLGRNHSSPDLPQLPVDALEIQYVSGVESPVRSGVEDVVEGIGSVSTEGDLHSTQDKTVDRDIHAEQQSGNPDGLETIASTASLDDESVECSVLERLRTLTFPLEQSLTTPSKQHSFLNVDLQVDDREKEGRVGTWQCWERAMQCESPLYACSLQMLSVRHSFHVRMFVLLSVSAQTLLLHPPVPPGPSCSLSRVWCLLWTQYKELYCNCKAPTGANQCGCSKGYHGDDLRCEGKP